MRRGAAMSESPPAAVPTVFASLDHPGASLAWNALRLVLRTQPRSVGFAGPRLK